MAKLRCYTLFFQHIAKPIETLCLSRCFCKAFFVSGGKVAENALCFQIGKGGNFGTDICVFLGGLKTDAAHACVHHKVERRKFTLLLGFCRKCLGIFQRKNSRTNVIAHQFGIGAYLTVPQDQNGLFDPCVAQFQSLRKGGHPKEGAVTFQMPSNRHSSVTVGIRLHHGHHGYTGFSRDRLKVMINGIQVNIHIIIETVHILPQKSSFCQYSTFFFS